MRPRVAESTELDLQTRRTRRAIWVAYLELLETKPSNQIRVKEICERALVHRVTFYKHFENKKDLIERGSYETLQEIAAKLDSPGITFSQTQLGETPTNFATLFQYAALNRSALSVLLQESDGNFRGSLISMLGELGIRRLRELQNNAPSVPMIHEGIVSSYIGGAIVSVLQWWLLQKSPPQPALIARVIGSLFVRDFGFNYPII